MAAKSLNGVIGKGLNMPWRVKGEQLLFKAMTYNKWLLVGRKTYESMGALPNRNYAILTSNIDYKPQYHAPSNYVGDFMIADNLPELLDELAKDTDHVIIAGGGEVYKQTIHLAHHIHLSIIQEEVEGDVMFPEIPDSFKSVFSTMFRSNIDYSYNILTRKL
jgi:dihydrofolate reductase (trimethoprim resistance protein)